MLYREKSVSSYTNVAIREEVSPLKISNMLTNITHTISKTEIKSIGL